MGLNYQDGSPILPSSLNKLLPASSKKRIIDIMDKRDLIRYHTADGSFRNMYESPTGAFVNYAVMKELVMQYARGIHRMASLPGIEGEAAFHNECLDNLNNLFEEYDPLDDQIKELEEKLNELKELKAKNAKDKT